MADVFSPAKRSEIMSRIRGKDTVIERRLRSALWRRGLRFRTQYGEYKIDVAFPRARVAVFADSCFFHGCPRHGRIPKTRPRFWADKIDQNRRRDQEVSRKLRALGWKVVRAWGHQLDASGAEAVALRIERAVRSRTGRAAAPDQ
jgi:DNA mismatch endonuclease (patch repair protein)